jgi:hypothetical protein
MNRKERRANAKINRKDNAKGHLNEVVFIEVLQQCAKILQQDSEQDYRMTPAMKDCVEVLITHEKNGVRHHMIAVDNVRKKIDTALNTNYGVEMPEGLGAFEFDIQEHLIECGVPREWRIISGTLDLLISRLMMLNGNIKYFNHNYDTGVLEEMA